MATNVCDQRELLPQAVMSEPTYKTTRLCIKGDCDLVVPFHVSELDEECQQDYKCCSACNNGY